MSASRHLHDLLAQLNKEVVVERVAGTQGVTLERDVAGYRECARWLARMACARATFSRNCPGTRPHQRNEALSAEIFLPAGKQRPLAELRHILPCSEQIV